MGVALAIEGGRWMVTLGGWLGEAAPPDEFGFVDYARSLPAPDIHDLVRDAEPASDFTVHKFPSNLRRHYEDLRSPPAGFLVIGDALCSFNPIYGQGMTVAALEAEALGQTMAALDVRGSGPERLPRAFFRAAGRIVDRPWALAIGEDFRFPGVSGPRPRAAALLNWYVGKLQEAATVDQEVPRLSQRHESYARARCCVLARRGLPCPAPFADGKPSGADRANPITAASGPPMKQ